jgi:hypothetical protein
MAFTAPCEEDMWRNYTHHWWGGTNDAEERIERHDRTEACLGFRIGLRVHQVLFADTTAVEAEHYLGILASHWVRLIAYEPAIADAPCLGCVDMAPVARVDLSFSHVAPPS